MKLMLRRRGARPGSGFTLAEVAVTLVIVGMTLLLVLQGLSTAKLIAAHSSNRKVARDLAILALGWAESGYLWEDLDGLPGTITGNFSEEDYDAFFYEIAVGQESRSSYDTGDSPYFDGRAYDRYRREEERDEPDDSEAYAETGTTGGPFEKVTVSVTFPKLGEESNLVKFERMIPLEQLYGRPDGDTQPTEEPEE